MACVLPTSPQMRLLTSTLCCNRKIPPDYIPEDKLYSITKETPNARIEGGKLKMSDKKPLLT